MPAAKKSKKEDEILTPTLRRYLNVQETAARIGYSAQTVGFMVQEGRLPAINIAMQPGKTNPCYRIPADAVPGAPPVPITPTPAPLPGQPVFRMLRIDDIKASLSCSTAHVIRLIEEGKMPAFNMAPFSSRRSYRIPLPGFERYLASCPSL